MIEFLIGVVFIRFFLRILSILLNTHATVPTEPILPFARTSFDDSR